MKANSWRAGANAIAMAGVFPLTAHASEDTAASVMSGKELIYSTCVACHGADGKGTIPGVPALTTAGGPLAQPDSVLRWHVLNDFHSSGSAMAMPPKGGNPTSATRMSPSWWTT